MFIKNCLTPCERILTVTPDVHLEQVIETLQAHQLHTIPVVDRLNRFLGITGYQHMMKAILDNRCSLKEGTVADALEPIRPLTLHSNFEETFPVIVRHPFVPIVDEDRMTFLGIVKISDIENALSSAFGTSIPGIRLLLGVVIDMPHQLEHVVDAIKPFDVNIITITTFDAGDPAARRILLKIEPTPHLSAIQQRLVNKGLRVLSVKERKAL